MPPPNDPLLFYGGAALCLAAAAQATAGGYGLLKRRERQRRAADADRIAFRREAATAAGAARARLATRLAWEGQRLLRVAGVVDESPDAKSFYLVDPAGHPLPRFLPGQYLTLGLPIAGVKAPVVRCYSLSDRPRPEYYRLTVRRQPAPPDAPGAPAGVGSGWLHDNLRQGHELSCAAPRGAFFLDPRTPRPVVLIGAGVGVTPIVSMLEAIHHARWTTPTHAFVGFRDGANHLLADATRAVAEADPHVSLRVVYSQPTEADRLGHDYHTRGRVSLELLRRELPSNNFDFYLCGPPRLMQTLVPELLDWGVPDDAIHYEAFGPASVSAPASSRLVEKAIGSAVRFAPDAEPIVWDGACASLLDLAEAAGVPVASGCRAGNCGACRVRVIEGKVAAIKRPGTPVAEGECLACISLPEGPVLIET